MSQCQSVVARGIVKVVIASPCAQIHIDCLKKLFPCKQDAPVLLEEYSIRVHVLRCSGFTFEIIEPTGPQSGVSEFLARNPAGGIQGFGVEVAEVSTVQGALSALDVPTLTPPGADAIVIDPAYLGGFSLTLAASVSGGD